MEKRRIKQIIQKIAIALAVILAVPNVPMVQNLGLGFTEAHANTEPITEKPLLNLGVGCVLSDDKKTATLTPRDYRQQDIPLSGGAIRYEFSLSIDEEEIPEDSWELITDNESMENSYQWILPDKVKGKEFFVSAYYHDDNNYADERAIYPVDLEAPVIKTVSEVTKTDEGYEFDIYLKKEENQEGTYYFYILTSYNDSESLTISADDIIDEVYNCCEENYESNNTVYGYEMVPMESTDFTIVADGSDFEPGIFVFQIVIMDPSENVSNKVITAPFITSLELTNDDIFASVNSNITYTGEDRQPSVTLTVNDEYSDVEKELYESKLNDAIKNNKITYTFKRVKDKDGNNISNEEASSTVKEIGLYEIYAESTDEDLVIEDESLGTFKVIDANVLAPDKDPNLSVSVSDDLTSYIITVDPSSITGIIGKSIEYSFNNGEYTTNNVYVAEANEEVVINTRFAATGYSLASSSKTTTITMDGTSVAPNITESGSFSTTKEVVIEAENLNDLIYYTIDGNEPTLDSESGTGRIELTVSATTTVKAFAVESGKIKSAVASSTYTFVDAPDNAPVLNVSESEDKTKYIVTVNVSSVTNKTGKTIEYSFNGQNYVTTNTYEATAGETVTAYIRFAATETTVASAPVSATIITSAASIAPTLTESESFATTKTVVIKAANSNDEIYYTIDGTEPTLSSAHDTDKIELNVSTTTTVKAFAIESGKIKSDVVSATYSLVEAPNNTPVLNVSVSEDKTKYIVTVNVSLITNKTGKTIEYSFNGQPYLTTNTYEADAGENVTAYIRFAATDTTVASADVSATTTTDAASATPTLTESGSFATTKTVEIKADNSSDVIYYTTDGSEPTLSSEHGSDKIELNVNATTTVKAFVVESGKIKSDVVSATYTLIEAPDHKPTLNVSVSNDKTKYIVTIDTTSVNNKTGKTIEYSFDGVNYGITNTYEAVAVETVTAYIRFAATETTVASAPVSATITTNAASVVPTLTVSGSFADTKAVEIKAANSTDVIYYTTDGSEPTLLSEHNTDKIDLNVSATTTVKAFAVESGKIRSSIVSSTYTFVEAPDNVPELNVSVSEDKTKYIVTVNVSSVTNKTGKTIEYSFNGQPYITTNTYEAAAGETVTAYIRFAATDTTVASSDVSATITTNAASAAPTLTASGSFASATKTIEIKAANSTDVIYYTTDGTEPTLTSANGTNKIELTVNATTTIKAFSVESNRIKSSVVSATYTYVEAPDKKPTLNISVSSDKTKYIVTVDTTSVNNMSGKTIEYSFDGVNYGTTNTYLANAGEAVTAYIRFAATETTVTSASVSETITTNTASAVATLTESGSFATTKTIEIKAANSTDKIYYTTDGTEPTLQSEPATGKKELTISATTTIKAFVVEEGKIKSNVVSETYTFVEAPDHKPTLYVSVSNDKANYIVTVDISSVTNNTGKTIEFSFDGENYGSTNTYDASAEETVTAYIRFSATNNTVASESKSATVITPRKSAAPTLTKEGSFLSDTISVEINGNNTGDTVYYSINNDELTLESNNVTGNTTLNNISTTTTIKAFAVEDGKIKSDVVTATYTKINPTINGIENDKTYNNKVNIIIDNASRTTVTLKKDNKNPDNITLTNGSTTIELTDLGVYVLKISDEFENEKSFSFSIAKEQINIISKTSAEDTTITYDPKATFDVSSLFTIIGNAGTATYSIVPDENATAGVGSLGVDGKTLTVTKAGIITIKVNTSGSTYVAPAEATASFTVKKAKGNINVTINNVTYGTAVSPIVSSTTNIGNYSIVYKNNAITNDAIASNIPVEVGSYTATVTYPENDLYEKVEASVNFDITPATLTVVANNIIKKVESKDPELTYAVNGLQYNDTATNVISGKLVRSTGEDAGKEYPILQGDLKANKNYTISFIGATFTITPKDVYTISIEKNINEAGDVSESGSYVEGSEVTLTATANSGYKFVEWQEKETKAKVSDLSSFKYTVSSNRNLVAVFAKKKDFTLTLIAKSGTYGDSNIGDVTLKVFDGDVSLNIFDEKVKDITEYFIDESCSVKTNTINGADNEGDIPKFVGTYYVKVTVPETDDYKSASATTSFTINAPTRVPGPEPGPGPEPETNKVIWSKESVDWLVSFNNDSKTAKATFHLKDNSTPANSVSVDADNIVVVMFLDGTQKTFKATLKYNGYEFEDETTVKMHTEHEWVASSWDWMGTTYQNVSAKATFKCSKSGQEHQKILSASVHDKRRTDNKVVFIAKVTGPDDKTYTSTYTVIKNADNTETGKEGDGIEIGNGIVIIGLEDEYDYTGKQIKPAFQVIDENRNDAVLALNVDYTVKYGANKDAGEKAGTIEVKGKGNYTGAATSATFAIVNRRAELSEDEQKELVNLKGASVRISEKFTYTGAAQYPKSFELKLKGGSWTKYDTKDGITYTAGDNELKAVVTFSNNVNKGTATMLIEGATDDKGKITAVKKNFSIKAADLKDAKFADDMEGTYTVKGAKPDKLVVTWQANDDSEILTLVEGQDFKVKYSDNKAAGTGKIVITGKGNFTKKAEGGTFKINPMQVEAEDISVIVSDKTAANKVKVTILDAEGNALNQNKQLNVTVYNEEGTDLGKIKVKSGDKIIVNVTSKDTNNVIIDEAGIDVEVLVGTKLSKAKVAVNGYTTTYTGVPVELDDEAFNTIKVTIKGKELKIHEDFEIAGYKNNTKKGTMTVTIRGIENTSEDATPVSGTKTFKVKINPKSLN